MRAIVQRVSRANVTVGGETVGEIGIGFLILLGVSKEDSNADADYILSKVVGLRVFDDSEGKMNLTLADTGGEMLVVSQFTLYGDTRKGNRPSFIRAAGGDSALALNEYFVEKARRSVVTVKTGKFGAMMDVALLNEGPVTIILDSEKTI